MKTGVLINVFNECEWLDSAIRAVIDYFDEVVIVEGSYQLVLKVGSSLRSNDGTLEILESWKNNPKISILYKNEADEAQQIQCALDVLKEKKVDWYLLLNGDEIWKPADIKIMQNYMSIGDKTGIYQYRTHFYNFTNSFDLCTDAVMKRVFKVTPGARAIGINGVCWPDHNKSVDPGHPHSVPHVSVLPAFCRCYHYTEIKDVKKWLFKISWLKARDHNPRFDSWYADKDGVHHDETHLLKKFTGQHPDVVKETELYKLWVSDPSEFKKRLFGC